MKKRVLLALLSFVFLPATATADKRIPGGATYQVIGRGLTWASGVNNNFIMDVISPSTGMCLNVHNNDSASHSYSVTPVITSDLSVTTYTGNTGAWTSTTISPTAVTDTTLANSTDNYFINTAGAAHVVISISGGSGAGTADITIAETANQCGSGGGVLVSGCNKSIVGTVATGGNAVIVPTPSAGLFIHVCAYSVSGQATASGTETFANGTAGTCAAIGAILWQMVVTTGNSSNFLAVPAPSQLFQTTVAAQPLCGQNLPGSGANALFAVSYAIF